MIIVIRFFLVAASGSDTINIKLKLGSNQGKEIPDRSKLLNISP